MKRPIYDKIVKKTKQKTESVLPTKKFEDRADLKKLFVYVSIVTIGQGEHVVDLMDTLGCSVSFVQVGDGTATKDIKNILNIEDNRKEIVFSVLREDLIESAEQELSALFASSKKARGIAFVLPMSSIVGVQVYKFLTRTI